MNRFKLLLIVLLLLDASSTLAQVCQGSTGTPVLYTNFANGLPGKSNLNYTDSVPSRGFFSIKSTTANLNPNWLSVGSSGNNRVVIVNSASTPKYIYTDTIKTLCGGTTYVFTADLLNLIKDQTSAASVTFIVKTTDGEQQQVQYAASGGLGNTQTGIAFTTPNTGGDVILTLVANPAHDKDEVFAMTALTIQTCGPRMTASFSKPDIVTTEAVCEGTTQTFNLTSLMYEQYDTPFYQWQMRTSVSGNWVDIPGATSPDYTYNMVNGVAGTYSFRMVGGKTVNKNTPTCISYSSLATIVVNKYPVANATISTPVCEGGTLTLDATGGSSYYWTGPNGFTSNKKSPVISNLTQANAGTYYVAVTTNGCTTPTSINVVINTIPIATIGSDVTICKGDQTTLSAGGGLSYQWSPALGLSDVNSANPVASPSVTTTYTVTVFNSSGCSTEASVKVTVNPLATANAGADKSTIQDKPVTLIGMVSNGGGFYWTPTDYLNDPHILNPVATPPFDITYTLHALPLGPCTMEATDQVFVQVFKKIVVPNTFSPNADGVNDTWAIEGLSSYPLAFTQVFNRYGGLVFQAQGYPKPWDGKLNGALLKFGTYYYKIDLKNGVVLSGWIMIVR
jgi:gliding motility-associated-like protein